MRMPFLGSDGSYRMRTLKDTTVKDHLRVWLGWSTFGRTLLFREMSSRSINTTMRDFVAWMKIVVTLMFYKCTVKSLFENKNGMFKHLPMDWGLTKNKFMDMWCALQPTVRACSTTGLITCKIPFYCNIPFVMGHVVHIGGTHFSEPCNA
jgi:hypothetical protein